jgi:predicted ArsR family transcriptional regulator
MSVNKNQIEEIHLLTHSLRYDIVQLLSSGPMFIGQIADKLKVNPRLVSFHLATLLDNGFVEGEWKVSKFPSSKGKAVKEYELTEKGKNSLKALAKVSDTT